MESSLVVVNLLLFCSTLIETRTFLPVLDCNLKPGCPYETPFLVTSLSEKFGSLRIVPSEALCAFMCQLNSECVSFNQLQNGECHMFRTLPYKVVEGSFCKFYKISNKCDERSSKSVAKTTNLAYQRPTCQSSSYPMNGFFLYPWLAVDGLNGTDPFHNECSHTDSVAGVTSWFMAELRAMAEVREVKVLVRKAVEFSTFVRILNLTIGVTNESWPLKQPVTKYYQLCGYYKGPMVSAEWISIVCSLTIAPARFIVVHPGVSDGFMAICEIMVFGSSFLNC